MVVTRRMREIHVQNEEQDTLKANEMKRDTKGMDEIDLGYYEACFRYGIFCSFLDIKTEIQSM